MHSTDINLLFSYNRWANEKILTASRNLSYEQQTAPVLVSFGSLMGTMVHILGAEIVWRMRLQQGKSPGRMIRIDDFSSLDELTFRWHEEESAMLSFLDQLKDEDLERKITFTRLNGDIEESTLWKALIHVILHGMQFRAEAGVILTQYGQSPGDLDFIYYLRDIGKR